MAVPEPKARPRWPYFGSAQKILIGCGIGIWMCSSLAWVIIRPFNFPASALARAWVLWAGLMTMGAGIARWRMVAVISAVIGGGTAIYLGSWQLLKVFDDCDLSHMLDLRCVPGPGLVMTLAAGFISVWQGWRLRPLADQSTAGDA